MEIGAPRPTGGVASDFVDDNGKGIFLHPFIAFLHELGHAKQFIEYPWLFDAPRVAFDAINTAARMRLEKGLTFPEVRKILPTSKPVAPGWAVRVESDNMNKHEWPMCKEAGYPCRQYTEISLLYD
jgi:hypothetical protein